MTTTTEGASAPSNGVKMHLISTRPLPTGEYTLDAVYPVVWQLAREAGLKEADYGRTWTVYESANDYLASLD